MWCKILSKINIVNAQIQNKTQDIARSSHLLKSLLYTFKKFRNEGFDSVMLESETKCSTLNIKPELKTKRRKKILPGEEAPHEILHIKRN